MSLEEQIASHKSPYPQLELARALAVSKNIVCDAIKSARLSLRTKMQGTLIINAAALAAGHAREGGRGQPYSQTGIMVGVERA